MKGNLSIIFGEDNNLYLNLMENVWITEIDKYTASFINSDDIRRDYASKIDEFTKLNKDMLDELGDKRGRVVITYQDLKNSDRVYRLRVLYQKNRNKLNMDFVQRRIIELLKNEKDPRLSSEVIKGNLFLFETDFARQKMRDAEEKILTTREKTRLNNILVDYVIESTLSNLKIKDYEKSYFAIRKLDSFLERKKGYLVTPIIPTTKVVTKNNTNEKKDDNPIGFKNILIEKEYFDREDIESYEKEEEKKEEVKPSKKDSYVPKEDFIKRRMDEALKNGERISFSDLDLEYREYREEMENRNR